MSTNRLHYITLHFSSNH